MKRKIVIFLFSLLVIFILLILNISVAKPTSQLFYNLKRLYEKTQLNLKSTPKDKLSYQYELLDKRLVELLFIVNRGASSYVLTSSLRYSTTAGEITELIVNNNLKDESQLTRKKFETHFLIVKDLSQKKSNIGDEAKYVTDDLNYLRIYIDKLSLFENAAN